LIYIYVTGLTVLNLIFWVAVLFNLPGTWLMVLLAALVEWWQPDEFLYSWPVLYLAAGLALLGEILEFLLGATGARRAGGSKRGAVLAIIGGILGTLIGACIGAFAGSLLGDLWAGRPIAHSIDAGKGAAAGRLWGTIAKMGVGGAIVVLLAAAPFV
jgi:uncharacterized protein YqgC (DUF456 family)